MLISWCICVLICDSKHDVKDVKDAKGSMFFIFYLTVNMLEDRKPLGNLVLLFFLFSFHDES